MARIAFAVGIKTKAGLAAAQVVDAVHHHPVPGQVFGGDAAPKGRDIHAGIIFRQGLDGLDRQAGGQLGGKIRPDLLRLGDCFRVIDGLQQPPQVGPGVGGGLLGDLVPDLRDVLVIEQEGQRAVEGGVPAFDGQRKGQRGARKIPIAGFLPGAPRFEDDVPAGMVGDEVAALTGTR